MRPYPYDTLSGRSQNLDLGVLEWSSFPGRVWTRVEFVVVQLVDGNGGVLKQLSTQSTPLATNLYPIALCNLHRNLIILII